MWNTGCPFGTYNTPYWLHAIQEQCLLMPYVYTPAPTPTNPNPLTWPVPNIRSTIFAPQYGGWQPRLGIAYSMDPKTVIRAGFNVFDDHNAFTKDAQDARRQLAGWRTNYPFRPKPAGAGYLPGQSSLRSIFPGRCNPGLRATLGS